MFTVDLTFKKDYVNLKTIFNKTLFKNHYVMLRGYHGVGFDDFKDSFSYLQQYVQDMFKITLTVSWKVHIAVCHLLPFVEKNQTGLGNYAEQTSEAIHHQFKGTGSTINAL